MPTPKKKAAVKKSPKKKAVAKKAVAKTKTAAKPVEKVAVSALLFPLPKFKPVKIPARMGAVADLVYRTRLTRLALNKVVEAVKAQETALKDHVINNLPKSDADGISGRLGRVVIEPKEVPQVEDWDKFYKFIHRTKSFELLQKAVSVSAVNDRIESAVGKKKKTAVPGVKMFGFKTVSIQKAS